MPDEPGLMVPVAELRRFIDGLPNGVVPSSNIIIGLDSLIAQATGGDERLVGALLREHQAARRWWRSPSEIRRTGWANAHGAVDVMLYPDDEVVRTALSQQQGVPDDA